MKKRYSSKGIMVIPSPVKKEIKESEKVLVIKECYCQNGHDLISGRAVFNNYDGILIKVKRKRNRGLIALSPIFGEKSRITLDIDLTKDEILELCCPTCNSALPAYSSCGCGADLIALFTNENADFSDCVGVCNRIGCLNAEIKNGSELLSFSMINSM